MSESKYFATLKEPKIYAFTTTQYENTPWQGLKKGTGLLKVGYTEKNIEQRIWQQFPTKTPESQPFKVLLAEDAITNDNKLFRDNDIHRILERDGFKRVNGEWFECTIKDVKSAIFELKSGKKSSPGSYQTFPMRPEQKTAVDVTEQYFRQYEDNDDGKASHFLWNAKMRFGKTFTSYQLAKRMGWKRILVLTYKPAVVDAWREDLEAHKDFDGWQFVGKAERYEDMDPSKPIVWFASFQDILGRDKNGKIKERYESAHLEDWDCVILDEYHFGAWRDGAKELYDAEDKEKLGDEEFSEETFPLSVKHYLYLSGTPFRALSSGEFLEDQIYNWTYADEQRAKQNWDEALDGPNPYLELPQLVMLTYQMPEAIREVALRGEENEFDLNEFFRAEKRGTLDASSPNEFKYIHEKEVQDWIHLLRGKYMPANAIAGTDHKSPPVPFSDIRLQQHLTHTFWFLPSVASCKAMAELLRQEQNSYFNDYEIVVAAGTEAGIGLAALKPVRDAIGKGIGKKSITLSCGKLTTGVSIPPLSGIFMLRSTSSPESYFQAAFRVQTPWYLMNKDGTNPHQKEILKEKCYILDFAPSRALKLISEYNSKLSLNDPVGSVEKQVEEFLNFLPVLCYDGFSMQPLNATELLDIAISGTASTMLAKRWQSARMVNVDNATLERILSNPELLHALEQIEAFRNLGEDLTRVISSEKALNKTKKEKGKLEKKEEKQKEKDNKGFKAELKKKLLQFITRVPVFMYLTDYREITLKDVITNVEPQLFTKVTGLKVRDFQLLCDIGVFNSAVMNAAIFAFKRFEEGSLTYAGGEALSDKVGGFDAVITRDEFYAVTEEVR